MHEEARKEKEREEEREYKIYQICSIMHDCFAGMLTNSHFYFDTMIEVGIISYFCRPKPAS